MDPELLAQMFHEAYERLAPVNGYETRKESAKPWAEVPEKNRPLMIAVCQELLPKIAKLLHGQPTPFGDTCKEHLDAAIGWLHANRFRCHTSDCSVHEPSARCSCGLHKCLTDLRAVQSFAFGAAK